MPLLEELSERPHSISSQYKPLLQHVVVLRHGFEKLNDGLISFESLLQQSTGIPETQLLQVESQVDPEDICSLQFTSGTTGSPKVAMLRHR